MYYSFSKEQSHNFLSLPETGMGYQIIQAALRGSYERRQFIILNAELAIERDINQGRMIKALFLEGFQKIKTAAPLITFSSVRLISEKENKHIFREPKITGGGATDNPKESSNGTEQFVRLSAFEDDKRIDKVRECLLPGSYTTIKADYIACKKSGDDPVDRYALPNELDIEWAFYIQPSVADLLQRGIVQPANGKDGGGREVFFEDGTSAETFLKLMPY